VKGHYSYFMVEFHQSLTKVLNIFQKELHERLIEEISMWIKMLMVERGMLSSPICMESYSLCGGVE